MQHGSRFKNYSALSAAFLLLSQKSETQVIYRDIDPDEIIHEGEFYIDLDDDGMSDFKLVAAHDPSPGILPDFYRMRINPLDDNYAAYFIQAVPVTYSGAPSATYFGGATQVYFTVAPMLSEGEAVNNAFNFGSANANFYVQAYYYVYSSGNFEALTGGSWLNESNKFAALKLNIDGAIHFGWVRLSTTDTSLIVHDFAYEANPDTPIQTKIVNYSTSWISASDQGLTGTGADIQFSFTSAPDENDFLAYRVICVKQDAADFFSVADANLLSPLQYIEITPDGSAEYSSSFTASSLDSDGDPITTDLGYKLYVLNVMDPSTNYANILSKPSVLVQLIDTVYTVSEVDLLDAANAGDGSDIVVTFDDAEQNQGITEYRVMIVKRDSADLFTLADAESVLAGRYITAAPGIPSYEIYFDASSVDVDGDLIEPGKYKAFVLSVADGTTANTNSLAVPSPSATIETYTSVVHDILLEDIAEFGDGRDLKISFPAVPLEQTVDAYKVFITDVIDAFDFDLEAANAVSPANYLTVIPSGSDIVINGTVSTKDINGNLITFGVPYYVFVVSVASQYGIDDTISTASNEVIINFPDTSEAINNLISGVELYANENTVYLNFPTAVNGSAGISIRNSTGQIVFESVLQNQKNELRPDLSSGIYFVTVEWNGSILNGKIEIL